MGAVVNGYWSDFCRAAYFGKPTKDLEDGQKLILDVNDAMIDATRPGAPVTKGCRGRRSCISRNRASRYRSAPAVSATAWD